VAAAAAAAPATVMSARRISACRVGPTIAGFTAAEFSGLWATRNARAAFKPAGAQPRAPGAAGLQPGWLVRPRPGRRPAVRRIGWPSVGEAEPSPAMRRTGVEAGTYPACAPAAVDGRAAAGDAGPSNDDHI
jgi:hypothetical protein